VIRCEVIHAVLVSTTCQNGTPNEGFLGSFWQARFLLIKGCLLL
jgi:hypothetical protein